jgi:hypothetical protein
VLHVVIRVWGFSGIHDLDELWYNEAAFRLRRGEYVGDSPYSVRYLAIVPLAVAQSLFGINEYTTVITPMLYSVGCLLLVYAIAKIYAGQSTARMAAALWAIFPLDIIQATELHLDLPMTLFQSLSVYSLIRAEHTTGHARKALYTVSGAALGLAYLAKEVALVLVIFLAIRAVVRRHWDPGYLFLAAGFVAVELADMAWFASLTGNPWHRISGAVWGHHAQVIRAATDPPYRWLIDYAELLLSPLTSRSVYLAGFFWLVLAGSVWGWCRRDRVVWELSLWWVTVLVVLNFVPLDLTFQRPLFHHYPRTLHPVFVPGLIIAAYPLVRQVPRPSIRLLTVACLLPVTLTSVWLCRLDNRLWAETARHAFRILQSLPNDVVVVTDPVIVGQLRFFMGYSGSRVRDFADIAHPEVPSPSLWIYDRFSIAWTRRYWRPTWNAPTPPRCPDREVRVEGLPVRVHAIIERLGDIIPGFDRVLQRWNREPTRLFLCT